MKSGQKIILAFAPGRWNPNQVFGSSRYHLWTLASLGWRVVYIEPPVKFRVKRSVWKADDRDFHVLSPRFVPPYAVRFSSDNKLTDYWRRLTSRRLLSEALHYVHTLGGKVDFYWFGAPWQEYIAQSLSPGPVKVGFVYDELCESPALSSMQKKLLWQWEKRLLTRLDLALCNSQPILDKRKDFPARALLVENVISEKVFFTERSVHTDLEEKMKVLPRPLAAYGGVVDLRLDLDYFRKMMEMNPSLHLAMLGTVSPLIDEELKELVTNHPRIHLFGKIPYSAYPCLYDQADVLVLGHKRCGFTNGMYPAKLTEYFASGKPVVSVDLPEVVRVCRKEKVELVRVVSNSTEFATAVGEALTDHDEEKSAARIDYAKSHTFETAVRIVEQGLLQALEDVSSKERGS